MLERAEPADREAKARWQSSRRSWIDEELGAILLDGGYMVTDIVAARPLTHLDITNPPTAAATLNLVGD